MIFFMMGKENQTTTAFSKQNFLWLRTPTRKALVSLCLIPMINIQFPQFEVFVPEFTARAGTNQKEAATGCTAAAECLSVNSAVSIHLELDHQSCLTLLKCSFGHPAMQCLHEGSSALFSYTGECCPLGEKMAWNVTEYFSKFIIWCFQQNIEQGLRKMGKYRRYCLTSPPAYH